MSEEGKKVHIPGFWGFFVKVLISALILYFLFSQFDIVRLSNKIKQISWIKIALVVFFGFIVWFIEYLRFYITLRPIHRDNNTKLWRVFFSGYALRFIFPGGHGEIGKMFFISERRSELFWAYLVDKGSFGLAVLLSLMMGGGFYFSEYPLYIWIGAGVVSILVLSSIIFRKKAIFTTIRQYPYSKILPTALALSALQVIIISVQYWLVLYGEGVSFNVVFTLVCTVLVVIMIPISFGGLGVREWTALQILKYFQVSREIAIITPLMVFFTNVLLPALIGLAVILIFKMKPVLFAQNKSIHINNAVAIEK